MGYKSHKSVRLHKRDAENTRPEKLASAQDILFNDAVRKEVERKRFRGLALISGPQIWWVQQSNESLNLLKPNSFFKRSLAIEFWIRGECLTYCT